MFLACDKDGTLHTHQTKPIRAQYGRGVKDTFWESETKQDATVYLQQKYSSLSWEHDVIVIGCEDCINDDTDFDAEPCISCVLYSNCKPKDNA